MSTGYGHCKDRNGHKVYIDASQLQNRISICGDNDLEVLVSFDEENAGLIVSALYLAFLHNNWEWPL